MRGETQIIISMAEDFIASGIDKIEAIKRAMNEFNEAVENSLNYKYEPMNKHEIYKENEKLVYKVLHDKFPTMIGSQYYDDIVQEGKIALFTAIDKHNEDISSFGNYAYKRIFGVMGAYLERRVNNKKRYVDKEFNNITQISLEARFTDNNNSNVGTLKESITYRNYDYEVVENKISISQILEYAKKTDTCIYKNLIKYFELGSYAKVAEFIGENVWTTQRNFNKFIDEYKKLIKSDISRVGGVA